MVNYKREYRHKQYCEKIKLNPDMIDKEKAEFLLYVDGMMGCRLSPLARKMCQDKAKKGYKSYRRRVKNVEQVSEMRM